MFPGFRVRFPARAKEKGDHNMFPGFHNMFPGFHNMSPGFQALLIGGKRRKEPRSPARRALVRA